MGRWEPELPAGAPPLHLFLTPCPQRSARSPRTGSQLSFRTASLNFSVRAAGWGDPEVIFGCFPRSLEVAPAPRLASRRPILFCTF